MSQKTIGNKVRIDPEKFDITVQNLIDWLCEDRQNVECKAIIADSEDTINLLEKSAVAIGSDAIAISGSRGRLYFLIPIQLECSTDADCLISIEKITDGIWNLFLNGKQSVILMNHNGSNRIDQIPNNINSLAAHHLPSIAGLSNFRLISELFLVACDIENTDPLANLSNLTSLNLRLCNVLTNIDGLSNLTNLTSLGLSGCWALTNVDGLANMTGLTSLDLKSCNALTNVDGLANMTKLTSLDLGWCKALTNVDGLVNMTKLTSLNLTWCIALTNVDGLANMTGLTSLDLKSCNALTNVDGLANMTKLTSLDLGWCKALTNVDGLANMTGLTSLNLKECKALTNVDGLANMTGLTSLNLKECKALTNVDGLVNMTELISLNLYDCEALTNVDGLANMTKLTSLRLPYCGTLTNIDGLVNMTELISLDLSCCGALTNVDGLANMTKLTSLLLQRCSALTNVDGLVNMTELISLDLSHCGALTNVDGIANLTGLKGLYLKGCCTLPNFYSLANLTGLFTLDLTGNRVPDAIRSLSKLQNLRKLIINSYPTIKDLDKLAEFHSLKSLEHDNNPFAAFSIIIATATRRKDIEYFRDKKDKFSEMVSFTPHPEPLISRLAEAFGLAASQEWAVECFHTLLERMRQRDDILPETYEIVLKQGMKCGFPSFCGLFEAALCHDQALPTPGRIGVALYVLAEAPAEARTWAVDFLDQQLSQVTEDTSVAKALAPAVCLFYARMQITGRVNEWLARATRKDAPALKDRVLGALAPRDENGHALADLAREFLSGDLVTEYVKPSKLKTFIQKHAADKKGLTILFSQALVNRLKDAKMIDNAEALEIIHRIQNKGV